MCRGNSVAIFNDCRLDDMERVGGGGMGGGVQIILISRVKKSDRQSESQREYFLYYNDISHI